MQRVVFQLGAKGRSGKVLVILRFARKKKVQHFSQLNSAGAIVETIGVVAVVI